MDDAIHDAAGVARANQAFYAAHEARDAAAMSAVWEHSERVTCVHPGWPILRGWEEVGESWRGIFAGPGRSQFIITNVAIEVVGDTAWTTLEENLLDHGATHAIAATNVFVRAEAGWKLVNHHGSPVMAG